MPLFLEVRDDELFLVVTISKEVWKTKLIYVKHIGFCNFRGYIESVNNMSSTLMTLALQQVTGAVMTVFILLCFLLAKCALVAPLFFFFFIERNQLVLTLARDNHDLKIYLGPGNDKTMHNKNCELMVLSHQD